MKTIFTLSFVRLALAFVPQKLQISEMFRPSFSFFVSLNNEKDGENEAERLRAQAESLRKEIENMENELGDTRPRSYPPTATTVDRETDEMSLIGKRVLVTGANGRLGSVVCRYLLRNHPQTEIVAAVHVVGENSSTARGYGRLAYEVGAEDGVGTIGSAWSADDRVASFEWDESMSEYNLQNIRIVEVELLDPVQCQSVVEGCDAVVWCATDFQGNQPRSVSSLNLAFLARAVANPTKGRVEVEGLENMLGALKQARQNKDRNSGRTPKNDPINFVLASTAPDALDDVETPFGSFKGIKRQGEQLLRDYPSLTHVIVQIARFEDFFVPEGKEIYREDSDYNDARTTRDRKKTLRKINRRDAALALVDALTDESVRGKTVQIWTAT